MTPRVCPYCLHVHTPQARITAVFNGKRGKADMGGCMCSECDGAWVEFAYPDGRTELKLTNGRRVDGDELRAHVEAMQAEARIGWKREPTRKQRDNREGK